MVTLNEPVFVGVSDLAALGQNAIDTTNDAQVAQAKASLCFAEQVVAAWIGADTLIEHPVVKTLKDLPRLKNNIEVDDGPITTLNSVTVNGTALDPDDVEIAGHWTIFRNDRQLFPRSTTIVLDYLAGYRINTSDGESNMPRNVQQAILSMAVNLFANPITELTEERIGDYAYVKGRPQGEDEQALPLSIQNLLKAVRRPIM
jgi:hypothetical protein